MIINRPIIIATAVGLVLAVVAMAARAQLQGVLLAPQQATGAITATPVLTLGGNAMTLNGSEAVK